MGYEWNKEVIMMICFDKIDKVVVMRLSIRLYEGDMRYMKRVMEWEVY